MKEGCRLAVVDLSDMRVYSMPFTVDESYILAESGRIDLAKLIHNALVVSGAHDQAVHEKLDDQVKGEADIWVITQYLIHVYKAPKVGDELQITTRVTDGNRFLIRRYFEVLCDGELLMDIHTQYAAINFQTRQMSKVNADLVRQTDLLDDSLPMPAFEKLQRVPDVEGLSRFDYLPQADDIDENQHVNNLVYLRWCYASLAADFTATHTPIKVEVKYGKEILPEDYIHIDTLMQSSASEVVTQHTIHNTSKETVACDVRITWQEINE